MKLLIFLSSTPRTAFTASLVVILCSSPEVLWGQVAEDLLRQADRALDDASCTEAVPLYLEFLEMVPSGSDAEYARSIISSCARDDSGDAAGEATSNTPDVSIRSGLDGVRLCSDTEADLSARFGAPSERGRFKPTGDTVRYGSNTGSDPRVFGFWKRKEFRGTLRLMCWEKDQLSAFTVEGLDFSEATLSEIDEWVAREGLVFGLGSRDQAVCSPDYLIDYNQALRDRRGQPWCGSGQASESELSSSPLSVIFHWQQGNPREKGLVEHVCIMVPFRNCGLLEK